MRAAGGVLWRATPAAGIEIALVHRPRYGDWSLPKGKLSAAEHPLVAAAREVTEETGLTPRLGRRLVATSHRVGGQEKTVDYWAMEPVTGQFRPGDEVDELRWLGPAEAIALLTHPNERAPVERLSDAPLATTMVLLVRHGRAGNSEKWSGDDSLRPLDEAGRRQAGELAPILTVFRPTRVLSAEPVRCIDTVRPLAAALGLAVEVEPLFGEEGHAQDGRRATGLVRGLAGAGEPVVVGSQGGLIPDTVAQLAEEDAVSVGDVPAGKGSIWALSFAADGPRAGRLVAADYYPPP
ncbi:MAG: NUDIX hydrolase [Actinomycetota bacterium]|nr:NUDIX hydrolase [Actinomycetota bacterium]